MHRKTVILLIEDHLGDIHLTQIYFEEVASKYQLLIANSFAEGQVILRSHPIDLVLLDLTLPDSTGIRTLDLFLREFLDTPVIVMTSSPNEILGNQVIKAGAQDFLVKGQFDSRLLNRAIRYALQRFTDKKKLADAYKELALSEKRYIEAQAIAHFGDWELDIVSSEMIWSDEVFRIFGYNPQSISPSLSIYLSYVPAEEVPMVEQFFEQVEKDGQEHSIEHRIIRNGNKFRYLALHAKLLYDKTRDKIAVVGSVQDITARKVNHKLLIEKKMWGQAMRIQQEILADLGFYIRTQLYSLASHLFLLEQLLTRTPQDQPEYLEALKVAVEELSMATNNLVNFSVVGAEKLFKPNFSSIELDKEVKQLVRLLNIRFEKSNALIEAHLSPTLPVFLFADIQKINQVLFNLAEYYLQHAPGSKMLSVYFELSPVKGQKYSTLVVTFNLPPNTVPLPDYDAVEKHLEEHPQVHQFGGLPQNQLYLALYVVYRLLRILKADINQAGAEQLVLRIPVEVPVTLEQGYPKAPGHPLHILLVEDHFLNQIGIRKILQSWSNMVVVDTASDGQEAVEKCRETKYDLILMDLKMPRLDGLRAARQIRQTRKVPIIGISANPSQQEKMAIEEVGMEDYLEKPFKPEELYLKIIQVLGNSPH